jgi:methyl-accepting chemotaxis protein
VGGKLVGVIGVDVFVSSLIEQAKDIKIGQSGYIVIMNRDGTIIVHPNESLVQKFSIHDDPGLASLADELDKNKDRGWVRYTFGGVDKIAGYKRMKTTGWIVLATVPINELTDPLTEAVSSALKENTARTEENIARVIDEGVRHSLLGSMLAALFGVLTLAIGYRSINNALRPLEGLGEVARALAEGRLSEVTRRLKEIRYLEDDEIGALIKAFEAVGKDLVGTLNTIASKLECLA